MENNEEVTPETLRNMKVLNIRADEMDYLSQKYEIRDHTELFAWGIKMLVDISKLDEDGWRLSFYKCDIDLENKKVDYKNFSPIHFSSLNVLAPAKEGFARLPLPEDLNISQKNK
jgi:hypothetical protein